MVLQPVLVLAQLTLGDAESLVDRVVQIRALESQLQAVGLVRDHQILAARYADLDPHHRRDGIVCIGGTLIDAHPAGREPVVNRFQIVHAGADFLLGPIQALHIVEGDFEGDLHRRVSKSS
jgi:hypothetical protein